MAPKRKTSMNGIRDRTLTVAARDRLDLTGRRITIVGGTDGLGRALAQLALAHGAEVTVAGRTFRDAALPNLHFVAADLSSMRAAVALGTDLDPRVDALVLTTGIMAAPKRETTSEGIERDMAISALSRFAILSTLAPRLADGTRIFIMGFPGAGQLGDPDDLNAERAYQAFPVHMNTVAVNEALVLDGAARNPRLRYYGLNPGLIKTKIRANFLGEKSLKFRVLEGIIGLFMQTPERYAKRVLPLLFAPELEQRSGAMFGKKGTAILPTDGFDQALVARFRQSLDVLLARAVSDPT